MPFVGSQFDEEDFRRICELLLEKRGFDLSMYKNQCVKRRVASRVRARGFESAPPYLELLLRDDAEIDTLMAAISIHVSQFFRNPEVFAVLEKQVLPGLIGAALRRSDPHLRVWSVGCSSGEEPYSLALLLHELKPPQLKVSIAASDISGPILQQARSACFDRARLEAVPRRVQEQYFVVDGEKLCLREPICGMVEFIEHNILQGGGEPPADLILCRNVLIYFSREDQERILQRFAELLPPWGALVLGSAENLLGEVRGRFSLTHPAERIYRPR